jgi:alpha-L-fucosidase
MGSLRFLILGAIAAVLLAPGARAAERGGAQEVKGQHAAIGVVEARQDGKHTQHPDAQWFPEAGVGLFLHWDEASVRCLETSWPMIAGTGLSWARPPRVIRDDPAEFARIVREKDYDLTGRKPQITPNEYWALAAEFNPTNFHPEVWLKKAQAAGFRYAVLTTKHHNGFALWPSAFGGFNTRNTPMKGRDLVREFVDGCRAAGLKVGFYFSGPDWHFDRDFMSFLYPGSAARYRGKLPDLGPDHEPRVLQHTPEEIAAHHQAVAEMVRGQIEELLTRYGKIDVMWFDGGPSHPLHGKLFPIERIRQLQPGIVINPRFHGRGDYITPEGHLPEDLRLKSDEWGELCSCWAGSWSDTRRPFRPLNDVVGELVRCRASGINNLLDIGPTASGDLPPDAYGNLEKLGAWMKINGEAIYGTRALPRRETASVPASSKGDIRYLYLIPGKKPAAGDMTVSLAGVRYPGPYRAHLLGDERELPVTVTGDFSTAQPEPGLKVSSPSRHSGKSPEGIENSIDENSATKWCLGHGNRFPIIWQAEVIGPRAPVTSYALTSANDMPDRDPAAWRFSGSRDGVNWTLLDERKEQPAWEKRNTKKTFTLSNATAYSHYRFEFLGVHNGAPMFQLSEIALLPTPIAGGTVTLSVPAPTPAAGVRVVKLEPRR